MMLFEQRLSQRSSTTKASRLFRRSSFRQINAKEILMDPQYVSVDVLGTIFQFIRDIASWLQHIAESSSVLLSK